jgi:hypothetical protein
MDYCKFQNTCEDLAKCVEHIESNRRFPDEWEVAAYHRLRLLCERVAQHEPINPRSE